MPDPKGMKEEKRVSNVHVRGEKSEVEKKVREGGVGKLDYQVLT